MSVQMGGEDRAQLAQILQSHGVVVKGGQEQAIALLEALLVSCAVWHTSLHYCTAAGLR